ncbi:hypothetical protein QVM62_27485 [Pseudomonas putida]|uniref:hypothetical protein n=1 Tax=Pseudomonas TaxID=286 RepID=UPI001E476D48|nr:hypothetical protein [Pseudomonas asiatica]MCE0756049.1 hypothetical protein [Pseudomonas asiatica]
MEPLGLPFVPVSMPVSDAGRITVRCFQWNYSTWPHRREVLPVATVGKPSAPAARLVAVVYRNAAG